MQLPVIPGILKHPKIQDLRRMLKDPAVARKYTLEALRVAPWPALRLFPRWWLLQCLDEAQLREGRRRALVFMLAA